MDDTVRDRLTGLVQEHGVELLQDPARLEAFLRDLCPGSKAEIYCLVAGIREGAVNELRGADPGRSPEAARDHVIQRLSRDLRFDEEAATWTVNTVIAALDAAAQDAPASDHLDHVGYCASCHAMMSSNADLETCFECGAALIDVRPLTQDSPDDRQDEIAWNGESGVPLPRQETEEAAGESIVESPVVDGGLRRQIDAFAVVPQEDPSESAEIAAHVDGASACGDTDPPLGSGERPTLGRRQTERRTTWIAAAIALVAVLILVVAVASIADNSSPKSAVEPATGSAYSESEMRSAYVINETDQAPNSSRAWAVGDGGVILVSNDGGRTWSRQYSGVDGNIVDVSAFSETNCRVTLAGSVQLSTDDGGATWE